MHNQNLSVAKKVHTREPDLNDFSKPVKIYFICW